MDERKQLYKRICLSLIIALGLGILVFSGLYRCPFLMIFKVPCPSCGLTRAVISALRGKYSMAFHYHPLWPLVELGIIIHVMHEFTIIKLSKLQATLGLWIIAIALLICYIYRLAKGF